MAKRKTNHLLKTEGYLWDAVADGTKTYEIRLNDRGFQTGDTLWLYRLKDDKTGGVDTTVDHLVKRISHILQGGQFGLEPRYCILSLEDA